MPSRAVGRAHVASIVAGALWSVAAMAEAQPSPGPADVAVLSLSSSEAADLHSLRRLINPGSGRAVVDVQMDIVRSTAAFGPVLLVAPDDTTAGAILAKCESYGLCESLARGRVRLGVVPHDSPWIRDYGPFVERGPSGARVVDANYDDEREDATLERALREATLRRERALALLRASMEDGGRVSSLMALLDGEKSGAESDPMTAVQQEVAYWRDYLELLRDKAAYQRRRQDDQSSFGIARLLMGDAPFEYETTKLVIDGGNLLKLADGSCLSTRGLYLHNPAAPQSVSADVNRLFGCRDTIILEALPGEHVIDHVDMFVLPVDGKRLLLPDYGLTQNHIALAWPTLTEPIRDLLAQAAIAMDRNREILVRRGFTVVRVPGLPPRLSDDESLYYPTMLNALVRSDGATRQVLVPRYAGYFDRVQDEALTIVRREFGPTATVQTIESTVAAEQQGAVHCLTITAPIEGSMFASNAGTAVLKTLNERAVLDRPFEPLTHPSLVGRWSVQRVGTTSVAGTGVDVVIEFDEESLRVRTAERVVSASYAVLGDRDGLLTTARRWPLEIVFDRGKQTATHARVEWISNRRAALILENGDTFMLVKRPSLTELDTGTRHLTLGTAATATLASSEDQDDRGRRLQAWRLSATEGQRVSIVAESDAFAPSVQIIGPGLPEPLKGQDLAVLQMSVAHVAFPETGDYTIVVGVADDGVAGEYQLVVELDDRPANQPSAALIDYVKGLPAAGRSVRVGERLQGRIADDTPRGPTSARLSAWTLERCEAGRVRVTVKSEAFDALLVVASSELDAPLSNDDEAPDSINAALDFDCSRTASFTIFAGSLEGEAGTYELAVEQLDRR